MSASTISLHITGLVMGDFPSSPIPIPLPPKQSVAANQPDQLLPVLSPSSQSSVPPVHPTLQVPSSVSSPPPRPIPQALQAVPIPLSS